MIAIMFEDLESHLIGTRRADRVFQAGETLFRAGDAVRTIHFVTDGVIELVRHQPGGAPLVLQRAARGSVLAEAALYSNRYHCDAVAKGAATTLAFRKSDLLRALADNSNFACAWARRLALDVQKARFQAEVLSLKTVAARLDAWISWHGKLPPKGDWLGLAAEIGVSPEALYRELAKRRQMNQAT
jgi:CRP-like cAMP-binding protein